jgi:chemotaxis protein histidine kinase CheA
MDIVNAIGDVDEGVIAFKIENGEFTIVPGILRHGPVTFNVTDFVVPTETNYKRNKPITANIGTDYNMYNDGSDELEENLKPEMITFMKDLYEYYRNDNELVRAEQDRIEAEKAAEARIAAEKAAEEAAEAAEKAEKQAADEKTAASQKAAEEAAEEAAQAQKIAEEAAAAQTELEEAAQIAAEEEQKKIIELGNIGLEKFKKDLENPLKSLIYAFKTKYLDPLISEATGIHTSLLTGSNLGGLNRKVTNFINLYNSYREKYFKIVKIYNKIEQINITPGLTKIDEINNDLNRIMTQVPQYVKDIGELERKIQPEKSVVTYTRAKSVKELFDELVKPSENIKDEPFLTFKNKKGILKNYKGYVETDFIDNDKFIFKYDVVDKKNNYSVREDGIDKKIITSMVNFILEKDSSHTLERKERIVKKDIYPSSTPKQPVVPPLPIGQTPPYQKSTASSARSITPRSSRSQLQTPDSTRRSDALYKLNTTAKKRPRSNDS